MGLSGSVNHPKTPLSVINLQFERLRIGQNNLFILEMI